jgi:ribosomal protein S12 methylthiotransferase
LLVVSQDTSAYGVDVRYRTGFWRGRPVKTRMTELATALGELGVWVRLHYVYPYPHVDEVIPLMAEGKILPYLDVPFQHASPRILKLMKRPANAENTLARIKAWRVDLPGHHHPLDVHSRAFPAKRKTTSVRLLDFLEEAQLDRVGCFAYSPVDGAVGERLARSRSRGSSRGSPRALHGSAGAHQRRQARSQGRHDDARAGRRGARGATRFARSAADAPEIDGVVRVTGAAGLRVGEFAQVKITGADAHDLEGKQPQ